MVDVVDKKARSKMMTGIKGKNTKPELIVRRGLHRLGFRYRLHSRKLPGKPDLVFTRYKAIILVNGCFWHQHDCHLFKWPSTRKAFWRNKITGNKQRDLLNRERYRQSGWRVLVIWECALKGKTRQPVNEVIQAAAEWLTGDQGDAEITGR